MEVWAAQIWNNFFLKSLRPNTEVRMRESLDSPHNLIAEDRYACVCVK